MFLDGGVWANNPIMVVVVDALSAYNLSREQVEVFSIDTGNPPYQISKFAVRGGLFQWREIISGAMFLTTDNAQSQATLLLGSEKILRLEPTGRAARIQPDDWTAAVAQLPDLAKKDFDRNRASIAEFFRERAGPRHRFYTESRTESPH